MVEEAMDTPRFAAGLGAARSEQALSSMIELALPSFAIGYLAFVAGPHTHGIERVLAAAAILAVLAATGLGMARAIRSAARVRRAEVAISAASSSLESAGRVTRAVLATLEQDVIPALGKMLSATAAMASDRRMAVGVRNRLTTLRAAGENIETILKGVVGSPSAKPAERPVAATAAEAKPTVVTNLPSFAAAKSGDGRPRRVLIAETNGVHQLMLRTVLAQIGMETEFVAHGDELIEAWRREDWDLILLDTETPEIEGLAAARTIRSVEAKSGWKGTPIVALAADPSSRDVDGYTQAGIGAWLAKPIVGAALFKAIGTAMAEPTTATDWDPVEFAKVA
ncbi:response regulator [Phenylobacterium sp.]|jgi:CheY-like chemotaxis protein|uniref:response regulator n=1 Tax=Phenylobacterium sp. TaxID=1871053 RepID=UPI002E370528|nr:response regulator [Phenylobacterium sp.]HEX3365456.1 response regulator [Phenylobacterium sp.]